MMNGQQEKQGDLLNIEDVVTLISQKMLEQHVLQGEINMLEHLKTTLVQRGVATINPDHGIINKSP